MKLIEILQAQLAVLVATIRARLAKAIESVKLNPVIAGQFVTQVFAWLAGQGLNVSTTTQLVFQSVVALLVSLLVRSNVTPVKATGYAPSVVVASLKKKPCDGCK